MITKEEKQNWTFTFGVGMGLAGYYIKIYGTFLEARQKMIEKFGTHWAFQYSEEEWEDWEQRRPVFIVEKDLRKELELNWE